MCYAWVCVCVGLGRGGGGIGEEPPLEVDGAQWGEAVAVERQMGKFGEKWAAVGPCSLHAQSAKKTTPGKTLL